MANYYCEYCGAKFPSITTLTGNNCMRHPNGTGKHKLYEGSEKSRYTCKYCGASFTTLFMLTGNNCIKHPNGRGKHAPAL